MSRNFASCLVQLSLCSRLDLNAYLVLDKKPIRQEQKLKTLKKYTAQYSSGWKKRLELANLLYEMGRWSEAVLEYKQVIQGQPQLIKPRIQLGKILQLINRKDEAIAIYESAAFLAKNEATRQHLTGLIESCKGNMSSAIRNFKMAEALEPQNLAHWLAVGQAQMDIEHPSVALLTFERILDLDPNNYMALLYSHDLLLALGDLPEAEKYLGRAVEVAPQDIQTLKRVITSRCRKRLVFDAAGKQTKKLINDLLKQAPSSPEAHNLLARYYVLRREKQKGLEILEKLSEKYSGNPYAWYYYSLCLFGLSKNEMAADAILRAYKLSSTRRDREIYQALCEILPATGRLKELRPIMAEMLDSFPQIWSLWSATGRVLVEHLREIELGCNYSLHGRTLQPRLADAWFCHGKVLSLAGFYTKAIEVITQGWQFLPQEASSLKSVSAAICLGESYQKLGYVESGQEWLRVAYQQAEKLIAFNPEKARYWQEKALAELDFIAL